MPDIRFFVEKRHQKCYFILFIEEIGENARNIDRIMYSLMLHGALQRVKGIVTGDFYSNGDEFST